MLDFRDVELKYASDRPVLKGVSLTVQPGEVVGIVGASGGGKSSLLKILSGLQDADSGSVYFAGKRVKGPSEQLIPGTRISNLLTRILHWTGTIPFGKISVSKCSTCRMMSGNDFVRSF